jgi:hypothetical protein
LKKRLAARESKKLLLLLAWGFGHFAALGQVNKSLFGSLQAAQPSSEKEPLS